MTGGKGLGRGELLGYLCTGLRGIGEVGEKGVYWVHLGNSRFGMMMFGKLLIL